MKLQDEKLFRQHCYIDGEWVDAISRATIRVTNPANGEALGTVPKMGAEETRRAIEAADRALPAWRARTAKERAQILRHRWRHRDRRRDDLEPDRAQTDLHRLDRDRQAVDGTMRGDGEEGLA